MALAPPSEPSQLLPDPIKDSHQRQTFDEKARKWLNNCCSPSPHKAEHDHGQGVLMWSYKSALRR